MLAQLKVVTVNGRQVVDRNADAENVLIDLRREIYKYDSKTLANRIGISVSTLNAFRSGRTVWPRPATLFAIMDAVGFEIRIMPRGA